MNRFWWFLRGYWIVELTGASPDWALNRLMQQRIPFWNIQWPDRWTVRICIFPRDLDAVRSAAEQAMCEIRDSSEMGARQMMRGICHRPVLWVVLTLSVITVVFMPRFVLFYDVSGNDTIPDEVILRELEGIGVGFGVYGPKIRSQWVEDHMLNLVNGLQWITVNQSGCKAVVEVRERPPTPQVQDRKGFSNIVATRAGIITSQSVWTGQALKKVGDTVVEGEMLVSGVVDLERTFLLTRAQAEIFAQTWRRMEAVTPLTYLEKSRTGEQQTCVWLEIGKRRIKIFGNSGISTAACDKMSDRKSLSLPEGSVLPVSLFVETYTQVELTQTDVDAVQAREQLCEAVERTALEQMAAGEILRQKQRLENNGVYRLRAMLECREMIAKTVESNWIEED